MTEPIKFLENYSRGLFSRLEEFFVRATGCTATEFCAVSEFDDTVRSRASSIAPRCRKAFEWLDTEVRQHQAREGMQAFRAAKEIGGVRLVLGGGSRFGETQLHSVMGTTLYGDTILIPDPIMPWLERERVEERFQHVLVLKATHTILQLKPLVDAALPYPPVVVFPSFEKSLEENDEQTQTGIARLLTDVVAWATAEELTEVDEVVEFADRKPESFLQSVDSSRLFIAPGGSITSPLPRALEEYEEELRTWRSPEWIEWYLELPTHRRVLNGLFERIGPIYHLLENADEFVGHPLMCVAQQAHYFHLVSTASSGRLEALDHLDPRTSAAVDALNSRRLEWLSSISTEALVELRKNNENETFRKRLQSGLDRLRVSDLSDVDRVAAEVCREIDGAIAEHDRDMRKLQKKYARIHGQTATWALAGFGAALMPSLAPLLGGVAPFGIAGKYGHDKLAEVQEKSALERSYAGVFASLKP